MLGLAFWSGLLLLTLSWIGQTGLTGRRTGSRTASRPGLWSSTVPTAATTHDRGRRAEIAELREDKALADGLVIGHFLTQDHFTDRIDRLEDQVDELTVERDLLHGAAAADPRRRAPDERRTTPTARAPARLVTGPVAAPRVGR